MNECKLKEIPNTKPLDKNGAGREEKKKKAVTLTHLYITGGGGKWNHLFRSVSTGKCFF